MTKVKIGESIKNNYIIWRFMSFDKLVNLLETKKLFFSPLSYYAQTDPFEGYMPKVSFEAMASIFKERNNELEEVYSSLKDHLSKFPESPNKDFQDKNMKKIRDALDTQGDFMKKVHKTIVKGNTVNCWHINNHESEAMWKLYSESGKGIAIKTTVNSLKESIEVGEDNFLVQMGLVKYLDFYDENLTPKDCVIDGILAPLLKRLSYSHENELRLFIVPEITYKNLEIFEPKPMLVQVDIEKLIEHIYISPFSGEPFTSSVKTICSKFSLHENKVISSNLLNGHDELINILG